MVSVSNHSGAARTGPDGCRESGSGLQIESVRAVVVIFRRKNNNNKGTDGRVGHALLTFGSPGHIIVFNKINSIYDL